MSDPMFRIPDIEVTPVAGLGVVEVYQCPVLWTRHRTVAGNLALYLQIPGSPHTSLQKGVALLLNKD